jgi:nucleoside-diphosphate-sugar epimerase
MADGLESGIRRDCLASLSLIPDLFRKLRSHRIAVVGGTGFVGTWIAETVTVLNDEYGCQIRVDLLGRSTSQWREAHSRLIERDEIHLQQIDVRSSFELARDVTLVIYAAGIADPRVHASDPFQVHVAAVQGMTHALTAAARLEDLQRFLNLSSGLVLGGQAENRALRESDVGILDFTRIHNVYPEARRAAENLVSLFASQYRIPVCTARAFTFIGPFQSLDAPWAANNFMRDALTGNEIRLHGDGATRRSYLYGSDVAAWLLKMLVDGRDDGTYNLGGGQPVSHSEVASMVAARTTPTPPLVYKSQPANFARRHDFFPDLQHTKTTLGLSQAFEVEAAIERSMRWYAARLGVMRRIREARNAS